MLLWNLIDFFQWSIISFKVNKEDSILNQNYFCKIYQKTKLLKKWLYRMTVVDWLISNKNKWGHDDKKKSQDDITQQVYMVMRQQLPRQSMIKYY